MVCIIHDLHPFVQSQLNDAKGWLHLESYPLQNGFLYLGRSGSKPNFPITGEWLFCTADFLENWIVIVVAKPRGKTERRRAKKLPNFLLLFFLRTKKITKTCIINL